VRCDAELEVGRIKSFLPVVVLHQLHCILSKQPRGFFESSAYALLLVRSRLHLFYLVLLTELKDAYSECNI
jgi:hypothetical protein